jgi:hypothetical protein
MSWLYSLALVAEFSRAACLGGEPCAPLNSTPTPQAFYWPDKTTAALRLSRYGMTCAPLTADHGAAVLTWLQAGFRAKTFPWQEKAMDSTGNAPDSGANSTHSWKTAQRSLFADSTESSPTFPRWGMAVRGVLWPLPTLVRHTAVTAFSSWPTPTVQDSKNNGAPSQLQRNALSLNALVGGPLNPPWVEWLQGWPIGWTAYAPLEMDKSHSAPRSLGAYSQVKPNAHV